jgi:hypothetical protein
MGMIRRSSAKTVQVKKMIFSTVLAIMIVQGIFFMLFSIDNIDPNNRLTNEFPYVIEDPEMDDSIMQPQDPYDPQSVMRGTRDGDDELDINLKWLDGYGTIIGYMNSIKSADVDNDGEIEIIFGNYEGYLYVTGPSHTGYVEEWKTLIGTYLFGLALDDVDQDGTVEIIVGNQDGFMNIFGYNGTTFALEWTSEDLGSDLYGLTTADVDDDGDIEIIAGTSVSNIFEDNIFVFYWTGSTYTQEWSYALTTTLGYLGLFHVAVGDVDGDSDKEIVFGSYENELLQNDPPVNPVPPNPRPTSQFGGRFYVFGYDGTSGSPEWQSDDFGEWIMGLDVGNTDSDNDLEIVVTTYFGEVFVFSYNGIAYMSEWQSDGLSAYTSTVGKVDDSSYESIIISSWESISVYQSSGAFYQEAWTSPQLDSFVYGLGTGDISGDGLIEEILTGTNYRFYAHINDGSNFIVASESNNIGAMESICVADLDEDGISEIFFGTNNGSVMVASFAGSLVSFEDMISLSDRTITNLDVGDVDDDGTQEIIAVEGHTSTSWNENFVFRSAGNDAIVYIIEHDSSGYNIEDQINVDVGGAFCMEVGDVDDDGIPEILLGGTGYDEINDDPFVGQIEVIDHDSSGYDVVWESYYFDNWVMGVAIGDSDGDGNTEIITEDYDDGLGTNVLRLFRYSGATYSEIDTISIDSENFALDCGDTDSDMDLEIVSKGIFSGSLQMFGRTGSNYVEEWSNTLYTTFIDECFAISNLRDGGKEYLIFGELGVILYDYIGGIYVPIWVSEEVPASVKTLYVDDVDSSSGLDIIGSSGGYNFIYGEGAVQGQPIAVITVINDEIKVGELVRFDGSQSTGSGALEYFFDFGDGSNSGWVSAPIVFHTYTIEGTFTTTLRVRDETMAQSPLVSHEITVIKGNQKPIAIIDSISPNPANEGSLVSFVGHGTDEGEVTNYEWVSDINGWIGNQPNLNYSGLSSDIHNISFRVMDNEGLWSDFTYSYLRVNEIPKAKINFISPNPGTQGELVTFSGHGNDDGNITGYAWRSTVDGYLSSLSFFSRSSLSPGSHIIYLKVKDDDGVWSQEVSRGLEINQIPEAIIESITPNPVIIDDFVTFTGSGTDDGSINGYYWESDIDGFLSSSRTFSSSTLSVGEHTISLKVKDNRGVWSDIVTDILVVMEAPDNVLPIAFIDSVSPAALREGEGVTFIGHGIDDDGQVRKYLWESDIDGFLSGERSFTASDLSVGTHVITFKVQDDRDEWSEPTQTIVIVHEEKDEEAGALSMSSIEENLWLWILIIIIIVVIIVAIAALISSGKKQKQMQQQQVYYGFYDGKMQ